MRLVRLPENIGFAAANNVGIRATEGPLVLLLNSDTLVSAGQLEALCADNRRLALVSNGYADLQQRKLAQLGLGGTFDVCVFCDPCRPDQLKPAAWAWAALTEWRSDMPTVYVGDDPVDSAFAMAGGARFVRFRFRSRRGP